MRMTGMGRKVFVSYKYKDNDVKELPNVTQPTWPCDYVDYITMKQKLPGSQKKRKLPLIKLLIVYFELNWQAYAATIGASQPSVFNFFRYAFILRSLLN